MKLSTFASKNMVEIEDAKGNTILFSYSTPVAARIGGKAFKTSESPSVTTSRHINQAGYRNGKGMPQEWFDKLMIFEVKDDWKNINE